MPITASRLFGVFLRLGTTSFGGLAMIEPMRRRVVEDRGWLGQADFLDGVALCQLLPGATVVQLAAYVGARLRGAAGAAAAAAGFVLPAFVVMTSLSWLYFTYGGLAWAQQASRGLAAVVIALLLKTTWFLARSMRPWPDLVVSGAALAALWAGVGYLTVFALAALARWGLHRWAPQPAAAALPPPADAPVRVGPAPLLAIALILTALAALAWWQDRVLAAMAAIFVKIGLVSFGGGAVMIPILQWEAVERLNWLTLSQFLDGILLSYLTPGPLLILAAFVGFKVKGLIGALVATCAVFAGPTILAAGLTPWYRRLAGLEAVRPLIRGVLAATVGMLALVTVQMGRAALTDAPSAAIMLAAAAALIVFDLNLLGVAAGAALLSLALH